MTTTTPNLPAVIEARTPAVSDLTVGSHVRIALHSPFAGFSGVIVEHLPERRVTHGTITFTALEDFTVALNMFGEIKEFAFDRTELEAI